MSRELGDGACYVDSRWTSKTSMSTRITEWDVVSEQDLPGGEGLV